MDIDNGYVTMTEEERWTLIEMMNEFRDGQIQYKGNKEESNRPSRYKPAFR